MTVMGLTRSSNARFEGAITLTGPDGGTTDLLAASDRALESIRGARVAMIFQDPMTALNPVHRVGDQIAEQIRAHEPVSKQAASARAVDLLRRVGIPPPRGAGPVLPSRVFRRYAPAGDDRYGAVVLTPGPHRR
jgi:peptide/nickel transport system ATP-binding protein